MRIIVSQTLRREREREGAQERRGRDEEDKRENKGEMEMEYIFQWPSSNPIDRQTTGSAAKCQITFSKTTMTQDFFFNEYSTS
jgi:hypothetical protein